MGDREGAMKQIARPATAAEITEIVGPLDDAVLMRIVETEATDRGARGFHLGDRRRSDRHRAGTPSLPGFYEILKREEPEADERR
jgi:hypothetical protein